MKSSNSLFKDLPTFSLSSLKLSNMDPVNRCGVERCTVWGIIDRNSRIPTWQRWHIGLWELNNPIENLSTVESSAVGARDGYLSLVSGNGNMIDLFAWFSYFRVTIIRVCFCWSPDGLLPANASCKARREVVLTPYPVVPNVYDCSRTFCPLSQNNVGCPLKMSSSGPTHPIHIKTSASSFKAIWTVWTSRVCEMMKRSMWLSVTVNTFLVLHIHSRRYLNLTVNCL